MRKYLAFLYPAFLFLLASCSQLKNEMIAEPMVCKQSPQADYRSWIQAPSPELQAVADRTAFVVRVSESSFNIYVMMQQGSQCNTELMSQTKAMEEVVSNARAQPVPNQRCKAGPFFKQEENITEIEFFQIVAPFGLLHFSAGGESGGDSLEATEYYIKSDDSCDTVASVVQLTSLKNKNPIMRRRQVE
jgi:hypothetical protein